MPTYFNPSSHWILDTCSKESMDEKIKNKSKEFWILMTLASKGMLYHRLEYFNYIGTNWWN